MMVLQLLWVNHPRPRNEGRPARKCFRQPENERSTGFKSAYKTKHNPSTSTWLTSHFSLITSHSAILPMLPTFKKRSKRPPPAAPCASARPGGGLGNRGTPREGLDVPQLPRARRTHHLHLQRRPFPLARQRRPANACGAACACAADPSGTPGTLGRNATPKPRPRSCRPASRSSRSSIPAIWPARPASPTRRPEPPRRLKSHSLDPRPTHPRSPGTKRRHRDAPTLRRGAHLAPEFFELVDWIDDLTENRLQPRQHQWCAHCQGRAFLRQTETCPPR